MFIYGPVPSRRLGFSLGIDTIPYKTCSFDCIYCQLGKTTNKTIEIKEWNKDVTSVSCIREKEILKAIEKTLNPQSPIDYITFGGSGEPTLNSKLGSMIKQVKKMTSIPVAVLTNGSLLYKKEVRKSLMEADVVLPSFSAGTQALFEKINRPHPSITLDLMISGLTSFCKEFSAQGGAASGGKGLIWLEIMLIKNINDAPEHIRKLKSILNSLRLDKIHLNTVVRPPSEKLACPLDETELRKISTLLGCKSEVIAEFQCNKVETQNFASLPVLSQPNLKHKIYGIVKRRSVTSQDIANSLSIGCNEVKKYLAILEQEGKIKKGKHKNTVFYTTSY